jgi:hypothetical protein
MGLLEKAVDIEELGQHRFVTIYGKSGSGKTELGSTSPKPLLYLQVGDDGSNTIKKKKGIRGLHIKNLSELKSVLQELIGMAEKGRLKYKTVFADTFSMVTNIWVKENAVDKNKKMTQQMWGDLKSDTEELIRLGHQLAEYCWVLFSCHEVGDAFEGIEDEILPEIHPSTTKGARTYLEGMSNYGLHTLIKKKDVTIDGVEKTVPVYITQIGPNPYYWTKLQKPKELKVPTQVRNLTYTKLAQILDIESATSDQ